MTAPTWSQLARRVGWIIYTSYRHSGIRKWWRRRVTTRGIGPRLAMRAEQAMYGRVNSPAVHTLSQRPGSVMTIGEASDAVKALYLSDRAAKATAWHLAEQERARALVRQHLTLTQLHEPHMKHAGRESWEDVNEIFGLGPSKDIS